MEINNQNFMEIRPVAVPLVSGYEDSEYKRGDYIEQPALYDNHIPWEESSYNRAGPAINHLNGYEQFYHGHQGQECRTNYQADVAYPDSMKMPIHDPSRYIHNLECDCALCYGANIQGTYPETDLSQSKICDALYRGFEKFNSDIKPIGWERERNKLDCEGNVGSYDGELPSEENYIDQEYEYENRYDSEPAWEIASSPRALESTSNVIEWGEDGETQLGEISDTKPASSVETENHNESTPKKVAKENKKKAKSSRSRERRSKKHSTPIFHIKWEGFVEPGYETVGEACQLCEEELSIPQEQQHEYGDYESYELINQPQNYQEVSVLPCGHAFHTSCLDQATPEELLRNPICYLCLSCES